MRISIFISAQFKLLVENIKHRRPTVTGAGTPKQFVKFKTGTLILGVTVILWASYARKNVMHLKNNDHGAFLADQEMQRILHRGQ